MKTLVLSSVLLLASFTGQAQVRDGGSGPGNTSFSNSTLKTKMPDVFCKTPVLETQGSRIQISYKFSKLTQFTTFAGPVQNVYKALMKEEASITGQGNASVTTIIDGKKETIKDEVRRAMVKVTNLDEGNVKEQLIKAGFSKDKIAKVKFVRDYDLLETNVPVGELLDVTGKVLFRFVVAEMDGVEQNIWACR